MIIDGKARLRRLGVDVHPFARGDLAMIGNRDDLQAVLEARVPPPIKQASKLRIDQTDGLSHFFRSDPVVMMGLIGF